MKIVTVRCIFDYAIVVENDAEWIDQYSVAVNNVREAFRDLSADDLGYDFYEYEQRKPSSWDGECIPYGGDGNTRTSEYLTKEKQ